MGVRETQITTGHDFLYRRERMSRLARGRRRHKMVNIGQSMSFPLFIGRLNNNGVYYGTLV